MSQPSSFVGSFDLNSQTGVMSVLASIRASTLPAPEKNELRDLVFLYTKGGGDASVRIALEQKLITHHVVPISIKNSNSTGGPNLAFGSYRPTPTFKAAASTIPDFPMAASTPLPAAFPATVEVVPQPVAVMPEPTPDPVPAQPVPVQAPAPVAPVIVVEPAPALVPSAVLAPTTPEINYLDRIREIKTAVNSKVGNPVNLVDINNEVGREYMNALLEAMKKLSSGAVSEMGPVMQRLEQSFAAVELALANQLPTPVPVPVSVPVPIPVDIVPTPPSVPTIDTSIPVPPPVIDPVPVSTPAPVVSYSEVTPEANINPEPPVPTFSEESIPLADIPSSDQSLAQEKIVEEEKSGYETNYQNEVPVNKAPSLADQQKVLTPNDLPDASTLETGAAGDVLSTKEVDTGLEQLLSDWSIFKKSGLFGTGPRGREHPLYKKIADLQIPLILAGRFEGSTQEIRQSITDYMNGWRYEQGIVYQPGETFDRYLRRVIRHIIDLQKKHTQA